MNEDDFEISRLKDNTFRLTRTDTQDDKHTHLHSRKLCKSIIYNVVNEKIPLNSHTRTLESMYRVSDNGKYRDKLKQIIAVRKNKGKQKYVNNKKR